MFAIWQPVQVTNPEHERYGQAGVIFSNAFPDGSYTVKFDIDGGLLAVLPADMRGL